MIIITKANDPIEVKQITVSLYGPPGLGKTSTGFTAEAPLLFDFDRGAYRSQFRKDTVQIEDWKDADTMTVEDLAPYKTVIVDTAGRALDSLSAHLIAKNPKFKGFGGQLTLQGFGALKAGFIGWLRLLHSAGKDVILIAHMDEQKDGDTLMERLDITGGSKAEIYKVADAMGRIKLVGGKRVLNFNPTDTSFGKNPGQMPPIEIPDFHQKPDFFAGVLAEIKQKLNESSEEAMAEQEALQEYRKTFQGLDTAEEFTAKVAELVNAIPTVKALLVQIAETKGFKFVKAKRSFEAKAAA